MSTPPFSPFEQFCHDFFALFTQPSFKGNDYLTYLARPTNRRTGDEASIVDTAIVGPILGLLGFVPGDRVYNQTAGGTRPDYAPTHPNYGTCFIVEDKSTSETLTPNLTNPTSHLSQLFGYLRGLAVPLGWLTNGQVLLIIRRESGAVPVATLDIPAALAQWQYNQPLSAADEHALRVVWDCRAEMFAGNQALLHDIMLAEPAWLAQAVPLGAGSQAGERLLVEMVKSLLDDVRADALGQLTALLQRKADYHRRADWLADTSTQPATAELKLLRERLLDPLHLARGTLKLTDDHFSALDDLLRRASAEVGAYRSTNDLRKAMLDSVESAVGASSGAGWHGRADAFERTIAAPFAILSSTIIGWHGRQATLRAEYRAALAVADDYAVWTTLVQETMLGGLDENERRLEFATQTAYVVFIRLLLIRVCEDKGVLPARMLSDGGIKFWHDEHIPRYLAFVAGNPYEPLLHMAYSNAQNIYAHFFSGRELFNWYTLDERRLLMALHRLNRFNFAAVDSDIVGTIYSTYISREEKRNKGQYYTPQPIVQAILDHVGYTNTAMLNRRLIDPACGSGSFLVSAAKRLVAASASQAASDPSSVLERVRNALFGFDLNPFACYLAEVNLLIQVLDLVKAAAATGQRQSIERFHIYNVDALAQPSGVFPVASTLLAAENQIVEHIKARTPGSPFAGGFQFVVANPPYGATLSDAYKATLRDDWPRVFYGQPDTYTFFMALGVGLLADGGRLGYITPNTFLMGSNTAALRRELTAMLALDALIDLPQGIWDDANVDCVLLFGHRERDVQQRRAQSITVHTLALADSLQALTARRWRETLTHAQATWMDDRETRFNLRYDDLMRRIEAACTITSNGKSAIVRLGDVTDSSQGIIPYKTRADGTANLYIRLQNAVPTAAPEWKPLLDGSGFVGRYELRWGKEKPYLKYGSHLWCERDPKYFDLPKIMLVRLRNKSLKHRLVATYDEEGFYNRDNFNNIIAKGSDYDLKYILALFNSTLLNYWYRNLFDNVNINPSYFRQLPMCPADAATQAQLVALVDQLLAEHAALNGLRERGYRITTRHSKTTISIPAADLLARLQSDPTFSTVSLFDAEALGVVRVIDTTGGAATIRSNIYTPGAHPTRVVLSHNKWWFEVPDDDVRRFLVAYLSQPRWYGQTWKDIKHLAIMPETAALRQFWAAETAERSAITAQLASIARLDAELDAHVFRLYGMTNADIARIVNRPRAKKPVPQPRAQITHGKRPRFGK